VLLCDDLSVPLCLPALPTGRQAVGRVKGFNFTTKGARVPIAIRITKVHQGLSKNSKLSESSM